MAENKRNILVLLLAPCIVGAIVFYYINIFPVLDYLALLMDNQNSCFVDLLTVYYPMSQRIFEDYHTVQGYYYSPSFAILLSPLRWIDLNSVMYFWLIFQFTISFIFITITFSCLHISFSKYFLIYFLMNIVSCPMLHNIIWGQMSVLATLFIFCSFLLIVKNKTALSAVLLSFAVSIKFFILPTILFMAKRLRTKEIVYFSVFLFMLLGAVPFAFLGTDKAIAFYLWVAGSIRWLENALNTPLNTMYSSQYIINVLERLSFYCNADDFWLQYLRGWFSFAAYGLVVMNIIIAYFFLKRNNTDFVSPFIAMALSTPFYVKTSWTHYMVYLPFCQFYLFLQAVDYKSKRKKIIIFTLCILSVAFSSIFTLLFFETNVIYYFFGMPFYANLFLLIAFYMDSIPRLDFSLHRR